jgi:hypothetical protein
MSQALSILKHLQKSPITSMEAFQNYGVTRLASRIYDLKKEGHEIVSQMKQVKTRYGTTSVKQYKLKGKK